MVLTPSCARCSSVSHGSTSILRQHNEQWAEIIHYLISSFRNFSVYFFMPREASHCVISEES